MALFTAASKHFVKTAGKTSLHSVPDLNSAERFKVLCLVYRKTSFWPWKKAKIKPTLVSLNDILTKVSVAHLVIDLSIDVTLCKSCIGRVPIAEVVTGSLSSLVYTFQKVQSMRHDTLTLV